MEYKLTATGGLTTTIVVNVYICPFCKIEYDLLKDSERDPNYYYIGTYKGDKVCDSCAEKIRKIAGIEIVKGL